MNMIRTMGALLAAAAIGSAGAKDLDLAGAKIVIPEKSAPFERLAADDLAKFLGEMSGVQSSVVVEPQAVGEGVRVYVGATRAAVTVGIDPLEMDPQQYRVKAADGALYVVGGTPSGTSFGVSSLLGGRFGVYTVDWGVDRVPKNAHPSVPADLDETKKPSVIQRDVYTGIHGPWFEGPEGYGQKLADYNRRNFLTWLGQDQARQPGFMLTSRFNACHTFSWIIPAEKYAKAHPEWFSLDEKGERDFRDTGSQLCLSNPALRDEVTRRLDEAIAADRKNATSGWPTLYELSQNDSSPDHLCLCPECKALVGKFGGQNGLMLDFVNDIARRLKAKYPDVVLRTFAYECTEYPSKVHPADNVVVRYCDYYTKRLDCYPLTDPENAPQYDLYKSWMNANCRIELWSYCLPWLSYGSDAGSPGIPVSAVDAIVADTKLYAETGLERIFFEAEFDPFRPRAFRKLDYFLVAQRLFDATRDPGQLVGAFMEGSYGPAAEEMRGYLDFLLKSQRTKRTNLAGWKARNFAHLTPAFYAEARTLVEKALAKSRGDKAVSARICEAYSQILRGQLALMKSRPSKAAEYAKTFARYEKSERLRLSCAPFGPKKRAELMAMCDEEFLGYGARNCADLPEELKGLPQADVYCLPSDCQRCYGNGKREKDSVSSVPTSLFWNPDPKGKEGFSLPVRFSVYAEKGKSVGTELRDLPADGRYHWYRIGVAELDANAYVVVSPDWLLRVNLDSAYTAPLSGEEAPSNRYEVWISARFDGPAYVPGSAKENVLAVDRVIVVRK